MQICSGSFIQLIKTLVLWLMLLLVMVTMKCFCAYTILRPSGIPKVNYIWVDFYLTNGLYRRLPESSATKLFVVSDIFVTSPRMNSLDTQIGFLAIDKTDKLIFCPMFFIDRLIALKTERQMWADCFLIHLEMSWHYSVALIIHMLTWE